MPFTTKSINIRSLGACSLLCAALIAAPAAADRVHAAIFLAEIDAAEARALDTSRTDERVAQLRTKLPMSHWRPFYAHEAFDGRVSARYDDVTREVRERRAKVAETIVTIDEI